MATATFPYENCDLDFGSYSLGGDWTLTVATDDDGFSFRLIDADSLGKGVSKAAFALIQEWIDNDTAPRPRQAKYVSRIRLAYERHSEPSTVSADRADFAHDERLNSRVAA